MAVEGERTKPRDNPQIYADSLVGQALRLLGNRSGRPTIFGQALGRGAPANAFRRNYYSLSKKILHPIGRLVAS